MTAKLTRRAALLSGAAFVAMHRAALAQQGAPADRIWSGGPVLTMNDAAMRVEAVAERGGRIVAVGTAAEVMRLRGPQTQVIDLAGRAMIPGFVDCHGHITLGGLQALSANMLPAPDGEVNDIAAMQRVLRAWVAANQEAVRKANVIIGFGYDDSQLKELRHPTRDDLDQVSRDVPILLVHQSGHLGATNSKGLEVAGLTADTPDPAGGIFRRRQGSKEPNGVLEETGLMAVAFKLIAGIGVEGLKTFIENGANMWARFGYTTAQEARAVPAIAEAIKSVAAAGGFKNDIAVYVDVQSDRNYIIANHSTSYRNRMRVAGTKLSMDGSPQGFTAFRDKPYYNPVGNYPPGYAGYMTMKPQEVVDLVDWSFANNIPIVSHSNGEAANDAYITALKVATAKHPKLDRRPVLIHGQFIREDQVDAYQQLNVIPSLFPMHTYYWGDWHRDHTVGPVAAENISPTGWVRKRGMIFTSHHDAPVALPDSLRVLDATVTRRTRSGDILGPTQRVDVITGLKAMTIWSAYQLFEEATKGSIEVGKLADLVILSADPTAVPPDDIDQIKVQETIKEGQTIYRLTAEQQRRGNLMLPGGGADDPFQRFINTASVYRDVMRTPNPFTRGNSSLVKAMAAAPHDRGCINRFMDELVASMLL